MWEALSWLKYLLPTQGKLIILVAAGVSWKALSRYFDAAPGDVEGAFHRAVAQIDEALAQERRRAAA